VETTKLRPGAAVIIALCFLVATLEGFDIQAFGVAAPKLTGAFHLDPATLGWAGSATTIGLVTGALVGGWIADRVGRRPVLLAAVIAFGAGSIFTALTANAPELIGARVITGLGLGAALPNLIAIAAEISPPSRRGATTCAMFCGMPVGGASVALVSTLGPHLGWQAPFLVGGTLPLLLAPALYFRLPETRIRDDGEVKGGLLNALFGGGRAAPTLLLWLANLACLVVLYLMLNWLPTLVIAKGQSPQVGSAAAFIFNFVGIAGTLILGFAVDRFGFRWSLPLGFLVLAGVMTALGQAANAWSILSLAAAAGFLVVGGLFSLYGLAPLLYPAHVRSAGAGAAVGIGRIGSIIGPLVGGALRQAGWSAGHVLVAMLPVALVAGAAVFAMTFFAKIYEAPAS